MGPAEAIPFLGTIFIFFYGLSSGETHGSASVVSPLRGAHAGWMSRLKDWVSWSFFLECKAEETQEVGQQSSGSAMRMAEDFRGLPGS